MFEPNKILPNVCGLPVVFTNRHSNIIVVTMRARYRVSSLVRHGLRARERGVHRGTWKEKKHRDSSGVAMRLRIHHGFDVLRRERLPQGLSVGYNLIFPRSLRTGSCVDHTGAHINESC